MQKTYIVIGASAAGIAAVQKIRQCDLSARIICFSEETEPPYNKCFLAELLGEQKDLFEVYTKSIAALDALSIELHVATKVVAIDRTKKVVTCHNGKEYEYTALLLAVGAASRIPTCKYQKNMQGFFPFYTLHDALAVQAWVKEKKPKKTVVMGAGLTGLEVADALHAQGTSVTIIEQQEKLLPRHVDKEAADRISAALQHRGIDLVLGLGVKEILSDEHNHVSEIMLSDGSGKKVDMIIGALGSSARLELAESIGLAIEKGAVVTNNYLQTTDPAIFAAGDVALVKNKITGESVRTALWPDAVAQGMCAGSTMAGVAREYLGVVPVATSSFFGLSFHSAGFLEVQQSDWSERIERTSAGYAKVIFDAQGVVKGFICMGELVSHMVAYKRSLVTGIPLAE